MARSVRYHCWRQACHFDFQLKDGKVTATAVAETGDEQRNVEFTNAKLNDDTLTFVETRQLQDRKMEIEFTGKVGDTGIAFIRKVGEFGSPQATATWTEALWHAARKQSVFSHPTRQRGKQRIPR